MILGAYRDQFSDIVVLSHQPADQQRDQKFAPSANGFDSLAQNGVRGNKFLERRGLHAGLPTTQPRVQALTQGQNLEVMQCRNDSHAVGSLPVPSRADQGKSPDIPRSVPNFPASSLGSRV